MKSKLTCIMAPILGLLMSFSYAQEITISGNVTDQTGLPLPGVNIVVEGTTIGTQSDFDGNYVINGNQGQTLIFSYIGLKKVSIVIGTLSTIDVVMEEDAEALEEVVVTALGISRDKKSLGYSTQEVQGEELNTVKSGNFVNALSGKASGI